MLPFTLKVSKVVILTYLMLIWVVLLLSSCLHRQFVQGKAEIVSKTDSTLNDSSIFVGYVYYPQGGNGIFPAAGAQIWTENSNLSTISDTSGYYYIKTAPGIYTIKCQNEGNHWPLLIEEATDVSINKNEKIHINFHLGYTIE
jgi:hypothetical protein